MKLRRADAHQSGAYLATPPIGTVEAQGDLPVARFSPSPSLRKSFELPPLTGAKPLSLGNTSRLLVVGPFFRAAPLRYRLMLTEHGPHRVKPLMPDEVLTVTELAEYLRVHRSTIYRLLKAHKLPAFKIGSDYRFNREQIDEWRLKQDPGWAAKSHQDEKQDKS